jgi:hypothetical protein
VEGDVMAVGKTLTIYLAADLKKFNQGMTQAQGGLKGFAGSLKNMLGPALIGATAALGALATKMAIDGVKAAMDDEVAVAKLAKTMENLGLAHDTQKVEDYIRVLERSLGIADTELRPAYDRLVRALGDTEAAQDALKLSLDVAAGSGKTLQQVTDALGKAYEGNIAGLSRLGAGIDAATIKTGDMDAITAQLSRTFTGQADIAAETYEGKIQRLSTAADNMKEAFGKGLLDSLTAISGGTQDLVEDMGRLEASLETAGNISGKVLSGMISDTMNLVKLMGFLTDPGATWNYIWEDIAIDLRGLTEEEKKAARAANELAYAAALAGNAAQTAGKQTQAATDWWMRHANTVKFTTQAYIDFLAANRVTLDGIQAENKGYLDLAARQKQVNTFTSIQIETNKKLTTTRGAFTASVNLLNKAEQKLSDTYEELNHKLDRTATKLTNQTALLADARQAVQDYASGIQQNLLSGIDLETAFTDQFDDTGKATGKSLIEGFNKQIAQAEWFGNVLNEIQNQGADRSLIEQIASLGPATGGALAQQLIDDGLVQTMSDKWVGVQETTKGLAMSLVPEFLIAGQNSAEEMVKGTAQTLLERSQAFTNMGKNIGKKVGAKFKAEFLADIAAAVKEVEAIQTAARAERVASETARQVAITDQQVGQALAKIIQRSDNRLGVQGVPVLA